MPLHLPSGENATEKTEEVCSCRGLPTWAPVCASQTQIVSSKEPDTICLPSGENATDETECVCVKSGSTPVGGPVKSGRKRTKDKGRGLDKELVQPELVTTWIQRLRTTSIDPLHRFRSRGWRRKRGRRRRQTETGVVTMVDFRLRSTG